jgi:hypothetical protein
MVIVILNLHVTVLPIIYALLVLSGLPMPPGRTLIRILRSWQARGERRQSHRSRLKAHSEGELLLRTKSGIEAKAEEKC